MLYAISTMVRAITFKQSDLIDHSAQYKINQKESFKHGSKLVLQPLTCYIKTWNIRFLKRQTLTHLYQFCCMFLFILFIGTFFSQVTYVCLFVTLAILSTFKSVFT